MKRLMMYGVCAFLVLAQWTFADTATKIAGTGANVGGPGSVNWTNPGNITVDDVNYATANLGGNATSEYLQGTNFGFAIPGGATILGVQVTIMRQSSSNSMGNSIDDADLYLLKAGAIVGTDHAVNTDWPTTMTAASYGSGVDLWGTTWTPDQINATNFGVALSVRNESSISNRTASVDYIQVTVTYEVTLPIQLASFTAVSTVKGVELTWQTVSEVNNYGFYVERRAEGDTDFTELPNVFIPGHGTTIEPQDYSFSDNTAGSGVWYYRLRQVDLDGSINLTDAVRADLMVTGVTENAPREFALMQNYPNPFNPSTEVKFSVATSGHATLDVYNMLGQKVATLFNGVAEAGRYYGVRFDAAQLASGTYMYRLQSADKSDLKKMMLVR